MGRTRQARTPKKTGTLPVLPFPARGNGARAAAQLSERVRELEARLAGLEQEQRRLQRSLFAAEQVQRKLCAPRHLRRGRFEIASEIFPVRYISGDFYDIFPLRAATGLVVGDIAGKDLAAGLWFTHLMGLIRIHAGQQADPADALAAINRDLFRVQEVPQMASLFLARLDAQRGELLYSNAGHPPAFVLRHDDGVESLNEGGPLLGVIPRAAFRSSRVWLEPGDTLVSYSDGILECRNCREEEFGMERLLETALAARGSSANAMLFSLLAAVQDFAGNYPREDDFTVLVARRLP
ncbi:serine/threonine-protein phosphatase [Acidobacteriia bacterium AH_259_A11_L15]|nr:serine/threonine-protein phosphatase [Acidobacteriia bacterium AH_259_A11_L15]